MDGIIEKGIGALLIGVFILLIVDMIAELGYGAGSIFYKIWTPNTTGLTGFNLFIVGTALPLFETLAIMITPLLVGIKLLGIL